MASLLLRGFALGFAIAASPGPIFFLCLRRTLIRGWRHGLVSGFGVATADGFYAALAAFGVGAITSVLVGQQRWLALGGGAVLIAIGVKTTFERRPAADVAAAANGAGLVWDYLSTLGLTITNPSTIISFAALVAALGIGLQGGYLPPGLVVVGVFLGSATWWCVLAALAAGLRARMTAQMVRGISVISAIAIASLGLLALLSALST
ncbi:MAG TPA: LysE family transporter [Candidatus Dormibacteraeota bacterium]